MGFNPLDEKGTAIDKQFRNWTTLNVKPYDKSSVHPYTRTRIILMNGIEVEGAIFSHQFARHTDDAELKRRLATTRRIEQQQQKMINWFSPADESDLEVTLGYEQVAVDLTAWLARTEPDKNVKDALDFALLEDFDHLYRYANLMETTEGKEASQVVKELTEVMPGRPTILEHRHPFDGVRNPINARRADILTKLHILTIVSGEQQTMNLYMNIGNRAQEPVARALYQEIGMIEEQHVTHYESLDDPTTTWFERAVLHEYNECYMYYSCLQSETEDRFKSFWEQCMNDEIMHLHMACDHMRRYGSADPDALLPRAFPELTIFQSNKDYVRQILATQIDLTEKEAALVPEQKAPDRYHMYQNTVNDHEGFVPSQTVIQEHINRFGRDYRLETEGPHPVERLRAREAAVV